ncbi:kinase-like domain-containing protein [Triangularia setosa]|uniref:Kinase-like domain-containing protein n=1 Tax=Triangularia setosa TaxID=2587417 RepID=A0AAN7A3L1_9PEZI|nr:kinase-like domain-containing protein [Podospora setosa]
MCLFGRRRPASREASVVGLDPETELKNLRKRLQRSFVNNGLNNDKRFLPVTEIDRLVDINTVRSVLPKKASPEVVKFVYRHGKTLLLILVVGNEASPKDLLSIMESCWRHNLTDKHLPVDSTPCIGGRSPCRQPPLHHKAWNVVHDQIWVDMEFRFYTDQAMFTAPVFRKNKFIYQLPQGCVLPVIWRGRERDGHFSTVYEAHIHPAHHEDDKSAGQPMHVAIKKLKPLTSEPGYNVEMAWNHEASALEEINKLHHQNLIRPIAAIRCGPEYYIMFEWADGGSLRELWESQGPKPKDLNPDRIMSVIEELLGIVGALSTLHGTNTRTKTGNVVRRVANLADIAASEWLAVPANPVKRRQEGAKDYQDTTAPDAASKSPKNTPEIQVRYVEPSDDELSFRSGDPNRSYVSEESDASSDEHWRHGDLKPDNILQFKQSKTDSSRWLGTLKIADLGLAKQHVFATARRNDMTNQKYTTSHYEAPESVTNLHLPRSRRFDIWSMGCVILEFVIVILYGNNGLEAFYEQQKIRENPATDTLYFAVDRNVARVSDIASHWIAEILKKDPECNRTGGSALADIVRLVRDRLLVVELPSENMTAREISRCRADAGELKESLEDIWKKARDDEFQGGNYLCSATGWRNTTPPKPLRSMKPKKTATTARLGDDLPKIQRNLV